MARTCTSTSREAVGLEPSTLEALLPLAIVLPYLANSSGWILTEMGRQPWVVFGLLQTAQAYSPSVSRGEVLTSLITFIVIYSALIVVDVTLLSKVAKAGPQEAVKPVEIEDQGRAK